MDRKVHKQTVTFLVICIIAVFAIVFPERMAYAQNITTITGFSLKAAADFKTPKEGESITYPKNGFVSVVSSEPAVSNYNIKYLWGDQEHKKAYYQSHGDTGVFTPGKWTLTVYVRFRIPKHLRSI